MTLLGIQEALLGGGGMCLLALTLIQISPIKVDPWTWIARHVGRAINGEVIASVDALRVDVQYLKDQRERDLEDCQRDRAEARRTRILRFADEIRENRRHSEESFNQVLEDIDAYQDYCREHPRYPNTKAETAIGRIKEVYQKCIRDNSFL